MRNRSNHGKLPTSFFYLRLKLNQNSFTWACKILSKEWVFYTFWGQLVEPDSRLSKEVIGLIDNTVFIFVKFEVKLPGRGRIRNVAVLISYRQANLDHFCVFDITFDQEILAFLLRVIALVLFRTSSNDSWKLCVLNVWIFTIAMIL